jgi:uncharacterized protein (TIGR03118 family)
MHPAFLEDPMGFLSRSILAAALAMLAAGAARADGDDHFTFVQTNLVSNLAGQASFQDPNLLNAWGIAFAPGGDFWVNGNNSGLSLLFNGLGVASTGLPSVTVPLPALPLRADTGPLSSPTGIIWNPTSGFDLPGTKDAAVFIFDTEDGTISAWSPAVNLTNAVLVVDNSKIGTGGAVYKGLAFGVTATGPHLYATNFRAGTVDVYDATFTADLLDGQVPNAATATNIAGKFADPFLPPGFAPFGIQNVNGDLYVSYAKQDAAKHDDTAGAHLGFVDIFSTDGVLLRRFAAGGPLDAPWGLVQAPASFGVLANTILVGNFGDGRINVYAPEGFFLGQLQSSTGGPLTIDGLWDLTFGGGSTSSPDTLYFSAGPNAEANGLFGTITPKTSTR